MGGGLALLASEDYSPRKLDADCDACPFKQEGRRFRPVAPEVHSPDPRAVITVECPGPQEASQGKPFVGSTGQKLAGDLSKLGIEREMITWRNRIACAPGRDNKTDSNMRQAAKCCLPRYHAETKDDTAPTLFLGKWASAGTLSQKENAKARGMPVAVSGKAYMVGPHPTYCYFRKASMQVVLKAYLHRFSRVVHETWFPVWPTSHIWPTEDALACLNAMGPVIGWDVETLGIDPIGVPITCIGISDGIRNVSLPWDEYNTKKFGMVAGLASYGTIGFKCKEALLGVLNSRRIQVTQNGTYDVLALGSRNIPCRNDYDTKHYHSTLFPEILHGLEEISVQLLDIPDRWKYIFAQVKKAAELKGSDIYRERRQEDLRLYNVHDSYCTVKLHPELEYLIEHMGYPAARDLCNKAMLKAAVARKSYAWGWHIWPKRQKKIAGEIEGEIVSSRKKIDELAQRYEIDNFNPKSNPQLASLLYVTLEQPVVIRTKTGAPATGKDALADMEKNTKSAVVREFVGVLRRWKTHIKLKDAYITKLQGVLVVRPSADVTGQLSGRWSYRAPAIPTTPDRVKPMWVARPDHWLVMADYDQAEIRVFGQCSQDPTFLESFEPGKDPHTMAAMHAFGVTKEQALQNCDPKNPYSKTLRFLAKTYNFAGMYGRLVEEISAKAILAQLRPHLPGLTYRHVLGTLRLYWRHRQVALEHKRTIWSRSQREGFVEEPYSHRRRYFWGVPKDTETFNFPQQAGIAAMVDQAIIAIAKELDWVNEGFLLNKHDEIGLEGRNPLRLCGLLNKHMAQEWTIEGITVPYSIEYSIGYIWGGKKVGGNMLKFSCLEDVYAWWAGLTRAQKQGAPVWS